MAKAVKGLNAEIGARIKARRLELGLTRERLAKLSDYSTTFIQDVERGYSGLSSESIRAFSMALNISTDNLLFGNETESFEYLIEKLKTVPPEKFDIVIKTIDGVIDCSK